MEHIGVVRIHTLFGTAVVPTPFPADAISGVELCVSLGQWDWFESYAAWQAELERASGSAAAMALGLAKGRGMSVPIAALYSAV